MKLKAIFAASVFAAAAVAMAGVAQAKVAGARGEYAGQQGEPATPGDYGRGQGRRGGWGQQQTPPPPPSYQPPQGGYQPPQGGHRPPPPPSPGANGQQPYAGGYHPRGGHRPPPPPPGADPRYSGGYYGHRHRDWDRKRRRERFRDGAAVVLGLGVLGALASQPRYEDPYYGYDGQQPGYQPGYEPEYEPGYGPDDGYGPGEQPGDGYAYGQQQPGRGVIRCASNDYQPSYCAIPQGARANIRRRLSSAQCTYGRDWGIGPNAVWVANGCRAEFTLY